MQGMLTEIVAKYNYWIYVVLMMVGFYAMIGKRNLVKKLLGMNIFQTAIILLFVSSGVKRDGGIPILDKYEALKHGVDRAGVSALSGGDARENAKILHDILAGEDHSPRRNVVVLNAAYALHTSDKYEDLDACLAAAEESIDSGAALETLKRLAEVSQKVPAAS